LNEIVTPTFEPQLARDRIAQHFSGLKLHELVSVEKVFPTTVLPDLEAAIAKTLPAGEGNVDFAAFGGLHEFETVTFSFLVTERREPPVVSAARYMDIDLGDDAPGRCIITGMWFFHANGGPAALLVSQVAKHTGTPGARVEVIASPRAGGREAAQAILAVLAKGLLDNSVYKGRAVSFETTRSYHGGLGSLKVHRFPAMSIDQVILPRRTLDTLQRTVFGFVSTRKALREHGFSAKRGLLLYGAPGTGKTHFIRYLISQLTGHTCLIVTAEQVAAFDEIMAIARALQPSIVIIEDADLLARARETRNDCSQVLLNSLLNHMDGLTDDAEILFVLTTNRPETLEAAVRDRPGRIDQAIEIPKPDAECRARLLDLYKGKMTVPPSIVAECVRRTDGASAAFIRELARRMAQFALLRGEATIDDADMRFALEEMLGAGSFTAKALGAAELAQKA
jgi:hypothetical protein